MFKEIIKANLEKAIVNRNDELKKVDLTSAFKYCISNDDRKVKLVFKNQRQIGVKKGDSSPYNMQSNEACFEAWAAIIYTHYLREDGTVILEAEFGIDPDWHIYNKNPHFGRFLYRALRFSQQYDWFLLDDKLKAEVVKFEKYLKNGTFTNNTAKEECSEGGNNIERIVEDRFANVKKESTWLLEQLGIKNKNNALKRQLPVGLFKGSVDEKNRVFTGGLSDIDLWTIEGDTFYPVELKAKNKMVGSITEIFFYSNLAYDLFINNDKKDKSSSFQLNENGDKRGYSEILEKSANLRKVRGYLLFDDFEAADDRKGSNHPLITEKVKGVLNAQKSGSPDIKYDIKLYKLAIKLNDDTN